MQINRNTIRNISVNPNTQKNKPVENNVPDKPTTPTNNTPSTTNSSVSGYDILAQQNAAMINKPTAQPVVTKGSTPKATTTSTGDSQASGSLPSNKRGGNSEPTIQTKGIFSKIGDFFKKSAGWIVGGLALAALTIWCPVAGFATAFLGFGLAGKENPDRIIVR